MNKIKTKNNYIEIKYLNCDDSIKIVENWLKKLNRILSITQWKILKRLFKHATLYPLYIKLIFDIVSKWNSFYLPSSNDPFFKCINTEQCIQFYLNLLEIKYGESLVSSCLFYLTKSTNGLSENELEDIISLDDELLEKIFQYHEPPIRRFPITLWSRIRYDLNEYLTSRELDGLTVIYWYHRKFIEIINNIYIFPLHERTQNRRILNVIHYFLGI